MADDSPDTPVSKQLGKMAKYSTILKDLGYEDPTTWGHVEEQEMLDLMSALSTQNVPLGHRSAIRRTFRERRAQLDDAADVVNVAAVTLESSTSIATPTPISNSVAANLLSHLSTAGGPVRDAHRFLTPPSPHTTPATKIAKTASQKAHAEAVTQLLNSDLSSRLIFGRRNPQQPLRAYELAINQHAKACLAGDFGLIHKKPGGDWAVHDLQQAAMAANTAAGYGFAKQRGSRSKLFGHQTGSARGDGGSASIASAAELCAASP